MAVNIVCQLPGCQTTQLEMETALGDYLQGFCKVRGSFTYYQLELRLGDFGGLLLGSPLANGASVTVT